MDLAVAVLALLLAVAATVLATVANRRWARRGRGPVDGGSLAALTQAQAQLRAELGDLAATLATVRDEQAQAAAVAGAFGERADRERAGQAELAGSVAAMAGQVAELSVRVDALSTGLTAVTEATAGQRTALRRVAVVRYDAFADVGGRLSYSAAILDDTSSGLVITALSGKSDIRTYIKTVSAGSAEAPLTPEEQQAVAAAAGSMQ